MNRRIHWPETRVVVTGGNGFLGRVVCHKLRERGVETLFAPRRREYDLTQEADVDRMYAELRPDVVLHLAAEVGGIGANRAHPGRFFHANLAMGLHLIEHARRNAIRKFVQVGTVCSYPKFAPIPFREDDLWSGYPEETNAPYGIAKKALLVMLDAYREEYGLPSSVVVPVNLYGPGDNFDLETSHVIPALIRKCIEAVGVGAPTMECWGTGMATREFLYVDDAAEGVVRAAESIERPIPINLGTGEETRLIDLVDKVAFALGFEGEIVWNADKPDGQPRRCLDTSRASNLLRWNATTSLADGLKQTIEWYVSHGARGAA